MLAGIVPGRHPAITPSRERAGATDACSECLCYRLVALSDHSVHCVAALLRPAPNAHRPPGGVL